MFKKIGKQLSSAIADFGELPLSASREKRKYVLEGAFWVPEHNCIARHSSSSRTPEVRAEKLDTHKAEDSNHLATNPARKRIRDRYLF
jgi:hypothetical protein